MRDAIFLSASVPDPARAPELAATADSVAITSAVSALLFVTLGRRPLVWGGHPAITPMVWAVASAFDVHYGAWVRLYQSRYWDDQYPEDNERFRNVVYTERVPGNQAESLALMRRQMLTEHQFAGAVFIGGMQGIVDERDLFRDIQPRALIVPVTSTGGAAATLAPPSDDPEAELDYVGFFHQQLGISPSERRYPTPADQPESLAERLERKA